MEWQGRFACPCRGASHWILVVRSQFDDFLSGFCRVYQLLQLLLRLGVIRELGQSTPNLAGKTKVKSQESVTSDIQLCQLTSDKHRRLRLTRPDLGLSEYDRRQERKRGPVCELKRQAENPPYILNPCWPKT